MSASVRVHPAAASIRAVWRKLGRGSRGLLVVALTALVAGCTSSGQSGEGFVFLTVDKFSLTDGTPVGSVTSSRADSNVSTTVCVTLRNNLKNPTVTSPTGLDNVVVRSYTVRLTRLDGGAAPGPFTFNTAVTVPAGTTENGAVTGNTATFAIVLVPAQAKNEPPLAGAPLPLTATAEVTFRGRDGRGEEVETEGAVTVDFVPAGGDTAASCATS